MRTQSQDSHSLPLTHLIKVRELLLPFQVALGQEDACFLWTLSGCPASGSTQIAAQSRAVSSGLHQGQGWNGLALPSHPPLVLPAPSLGSSGGCAFHEAILEVAPGAAGGAGVLVVPAAARGWSSQLPSPRQACGGR